MRLQTTTIQALDDGTMTAEAPDETVLGEDPLAVPDASAGNDLQAPPVTGTDADILAAPDESAENDLPALQGRTVADTDTAATDTVIATEMKNDPLRDAHDPVPAHHDHHVAPHRAHCNAAAHCLHNRMLSLMWRNLERHLHQKSKSPISTLPGDWQPKATQSKFKVEKELS
jgi:hypothetical protein